jgi:hypothetical protein
LVSVGGRVPPAFVSPAKSGVGSSAGPVPFGGPARGHSGNPWRRPAAPGNLWKNPLVTPTAVLGDIHGDYERMLEVAGDLDPGVPLVVVGDYFDRWDHAVEAVRWLIRRPNTTALLGNHDALILGVVEETLHGEGGRNTENWLWNGGKVADLRRLMAEPELMEWLRARPAMAMIGDTLLQHSDSPVYLTYGADIDSINRSVERRLASRDPDALFQIFADLCKRRQFYSPQLVHDYLQVFGAKRLVHGHTPHSQPQAVSLFGGSIINVDGAMSRGFGPEPRGFVHWLPAEEADDSEGTSHRASRD